MYFLLRASGVCGQEKCVMNFLLRVSEFVGKRNVLCTSYSGSQEFVDKTGEENVVYIDPLGAVVIGAYILVSWWQTGVGQ